MSKAYMNDYEKIQRVGHCGPVETIWTFDEMNQIQDAFYRKGYIVNCFSRLDHTATRHDAMIVSRDDVPVILEYLFTQRIIVEVNVESSYLVAFIFVYNTSVEDIIGKIRYLPPKGGE